MKSANTSYIVITLMLGVLVFGALTMFGNVAGKDINNAIQTGDTSFIQVDKWINPSTYGDKVEKKADEYKSSNVDSDAGEAKSRFN